MSTARPRRTVWLLRIPSRAAPSSRAKPIICLLSRNTSDETFVNPIPNTSAYTARSAASVVSRPQKLFLKTQWLDASTGLTGSTVTRPPSSAPRQTPHE